MNIVTKVCILAVASISLAACAGSKNNGSNVASADSASNPPSSCIDKTNYELAYRQNVLYTIHEAGYTDVGYSAITQTSDDFHDPEYDVLVSAGKTVHVTCDDSGDDQCGCDIASPSNANAPAASHN